MDMELFFKNLGIEPDNSQTPQISTQAIDKAQIIPYNGNELVNQGMYSNGETDSDDDDSKDHFDVAFIVGEVGYDKSQLEGICSEIKAISEIIFERSNDVTISIYVTARETPSPNGTAELTTLKMLKLCLEKSSRKRYRTKMEWSLCPNVLIMSHLRIRIPNLRNAETEQNTALCSLTHCTKSKMNTMYSSILHNHQEQTNTA